MKNIGWIDETRQDKDMHRVLVMNSNSYGTTVALRYIPYVRHEEYWMD